jgi:D-arabinose 1-dehydrogenase-like Zn-dependent alcohol dehydrogenase
MHAAVLDHHGLEVRDWPDPQARAGEALVAITKVGICGSDVHLAIDGSARTSRLPLVLGHEPAGVVAALGPRTDGPPAGTRVAVLPLVVCGECDRCRAGRTVICPHRACLGVDRDGCWAEHVAVPVANLLVLPDGIDDAVAAIATDAVANAHHAVVRRGGVRPGMRVGVWGIGGLGLAAVAIARAAGATSILAVDPDGAARERARLAGADIVVDPSAARAAARGLGGLDLAVEMVGRAESIAATASALAEGGRAVIVGLGQGPAGAPSAMGFVLGERELVGSYGAEPDEIATVIDQLGRGELQIPGLVGDEVALADVPMALERLARGEAGGRLVVAVR